MNYLTTGRSWGTGGLQFVVGAIAEGLLGGVFATTEIGLAGGGGGVGGRIEFRALMGAVAKGLALAVTTGTPVIGFPGLGFDHIGSSLGNSWFHKQGILC